MGNLFGLPYVVMRKPAPIDTTTLNYHWQIWETNAFSIYTKETDKVDEQSAQEAVAAVLRYLSRVGLLRYKNQVAVIEWQLPDFFESMGKV